MKTAQNKRYEIEFFTTITKEIENYETLSENDYALIFSKISHYIPENATILEAGFGTGNFGRKLLSVKKIKKLIGCDITPKMIEKAKMFGRAQGNCEYILGDLEDETIFPKERFDCILCPFILHHFPSLVVSRNLVTWVKRKGAIICIEPNGDCIINKISKVIRNMILKLFGEEYLIKNKWGTPNETDHTISSYVANFVQQNRCRLIHSDLIKQYTSRSRNILVLFKLPFDSAW